MRLPDDDEFEPDFPSGDDSADPDAIVSCPYCGEAVNIALDPGGGPAQEYVEDCQVCCQPWRVSVRYQHDGQALVSLTALDE